MNKDKGTQPDWNDMGVFGLWGWKVSDVRLFIVQEGHGLKWPPKSVKYIDMIGGKFEDLELALEKEHVRKFVLGMISEGATHLSIGRGGKWKIYCLLDIDTAKEIYSIISSKFKELQLEG